MLLLESSREAMQPSQFISLTHIIFAICVMSRLLPLFAPARYSLPLLPTLLSARPYSNQPTCTRYLIRQPSPFAPRESPTPLIFVRAHGLRLASASGPPGGSDTSRSAGDAAVGTGPGDTEWKDWSGMFAEKGFTSIEIDITVPTQDPDLPASATQEGSTLETLASAVTALSSQIRLQAIPFPPVLVAQGPSTLLTQAYISDHPASGLVMLDPVDDERFTYEPNFPILLLGKEEGRVRAGRIGAMAKDVGRGGKGVRVVGVGDVRGEEGRMVSWRLGGG